MPISASQCRAARALLDWSQDDLALNAQVARPTIADFERQVRTPMRNNLVSISNALHAAGVHFIDDEEELGAGVRLRRVQLEYLNSIKPKDGGLVIKVRYRSVPYYAFLSRSVLDDIDRTHHTSIEEQTQAVQKRLPIFLNATETAIINGNYSEDSFIELDSTNLPSELF